MSRPRLLEIVAPKVVQLAPEHHLVDVGEQMDLFEVAS